MNVESIDHHPHHNCDKIAFPHKPALEIVQANRRGLHERVNNHPIHEPTT